MLGKLLKYEFKSLMNNLGVLYLVWLSLTLITAVLPKASKYTSEFVENLLYVVWAISFIAAIIMTLVVVIDRRFYKNFYGAEGYFTLSLPVKTSTHIWSKVIASTVWMVITAFVGIFIMMYSKHCDKWTRFLPSDKDIYEREAGRGKGNNNISV